jgi:hypothetical protein
MYIILVMVKVHSTRMLKTSCTCDENFHVRVAADWNFLATLRGKVHTMGMVEQ